MRHHTIISGTGRAGTTFLVKLLTRLGCDTCYHLTPENLASRGGLEWDLSDPTAPYFVKSPGLCENLQQVLAANKIKIDLAIVPMRNLRDAAESRRKNQTGQVGCDNVAGGLWGTADPMQQEVVLAERLHRLMLTLAVHEIPVLLLDFERLIKDAGYVFRQLKSLVPSVTEADFRTAFNDIAYS